MYRASHMEDEASFKGSLFPMASGMGKALTMDKLIARGFFGPNRCSMCLVHEENVNHLLVLSPVASFVWNHFFRLFIRSLVQLTSPLPLLIKWSQTSGEADLEMCSCCHMFVSLEGEKPADFLRDLYEALENCR